MKQKGIPEMDDVEEIISKISEESPYKRRPTQKRTWMTVPEMGKLLGLKKTDRYWLVHKNVFESKEIAGKIRINIASFEKWYANQIKYHKVTGEKPGKELKSWSYSVKEVADLLGVDEYLVYDLLKKNQMEAVIVDYWKRIPKDSFRNWYKSQSRYRTKEDREKDALLEDATITDERMRKLRERRAGGRTSADDGTDAGRTGSERPENYGTEQATKRIADLEREIEQRKQSREYRSIADKIKENRGTIDQRGRQQEKSRRRSRGMEI